MKVDLSEIRHEIARLEATGRHGIMLNQSKRFIAADAISVDGKWYPVNTSPLFSYGIHIVHNTPATVNMLWLDENGRAISECSYE